MIIGFIMTRKNSTRLKDKNLLPFNGTTLFEHSTREVMRAKSLNKVVVISDDERIWEICNTLGIEWVAEPDDLANQNNAHLVTEFLMDFLGLENRDLVVYLPPTAPLRTASDIDTAIELYLNQFCDSVVSMRECKDPPEWAFMIHKQTGLIDFREFIWTSQDLNQFYVLNGALYVARVNFLKQNRGYFSRQTIPYIMPYERSIDIDEREDYELALYYFNKKKGG